MPRTNEGRPGRAAAAAAPTFTIDSDLRDLVHSGVAVLVSTGDAERRPHVAYGWGPRVRDDGHTIDVFLDAARAEQTLKNASANGKIAMTVAEPVSHRSVQFKGRFLEHGPPTAEDEAWVERHRSDFMVTTSLVGDPPKTIQNLWMDEVVRVSFVCERAFNQTPGPDAGKPL